MGAAERRKLKLRRCYFHGSPNVTDASLAAIRRAKDACVADSSFSSLPRVQYLVIAFRAGTLLPPPPQHHNLIPFSPSWHPFLISPFVVVLYYVAHFTVWVGQVGFGALLSILLMEESYHLRISRINISVEMRKVKSYDAKLILTIEVSTQ